jgi:hypothetical protein
LLQFAATLQENIDHINYLEADPKAMVRMEWSGQLTTFVHKVPRLI